ncbi:MAG: hypothetical protein P4L92_06520 [Rudaea sp.]|nr:hypothetical protein [Rudaea sp.]
MKASDKKLTYELDTFHNFVSVVGLEIDEGSIKQDVPPKPDISSTIVGIKWYFEMTRLTDEQIETKVVNGRSGYSNFRIETEDVLCAIRGKHEKRYAADASVDLVVHEGATPIDGFWARGQTDRLRDLTRSRKFRKPVHSGLANGPFSRQVSCGRKSEANIVRLPLVSCFCAQERAASGVLALRRTHAGKAEGWRVRCAPVRCTYRYVRSTNPGVRPRTRRAGCQESAAPGQREVTRSAEGQAEALLLALRSAAYRDIRLLTAARVIR